MIERPEQRDRRSTWALRRLPHNPGRSAKQAEHPFFNAGRNKAKSKADRGRDRRDPPAAKNQADRAKREAECQPAASQLAAELLCLEVLRQHLVRDQKRVRTIY